MNFHEHFFYRSQLGSMITEYRSASAVSKINAQQNTSSLWRNDVQTIIFMVRLRAKCGNIYEHAVSNARVNVNCILIAKGGTVHLLHARPRDPPGAAYENTKFTVETSARMLFRLFVIFPSFCGF